jgi:fibronectin-binding autotransporter adhesin
LTVTSGGTVILSTTGGNSYAGGTTISGTAVLSISADNQLGNLPNTAIGSGGTPVTFNGGTLLGTANITTARNMLVGAAGGTLSEASGFTLTASGGISGAGVSTAR